jgi:hypothetical protein
MAGFKPLAVARNQRRISLQPEDCRIDQNGSDYQTLEQRRTNKSAQTVLQWPRCH